MNRAKLAITTAVLAAGLVACGPSHASVKSSPDKVVGKASTPAAAPTTKAAPPSPTKPAAAHIGDTITLHGMEDGEQVAVTIVKWVDPAKSGNEFETPQAGNRYVAAQVRVTNTGKAVYSDTPENGIQVADTDGQRFQPTYIDLTAGPGMASDVKLRTGDKALGFIAFEVPKKSKIASVQFTMNSGFADEVGQWNIS